MPGLKALTPLKTLAEEAWLKKLGSKSWAKKLGLKREFQPLA